MPAKKQFMLRLRFTVTIPGFEPLELRQEYPVTGPKNKQWERIKYRVIKAMEAYDDGAAYKENKAILKEIILFELKKIGQDGQELQPVFYWLMGNKNMPVYDAGKIKEYFKNFLAQQKPLLTATSIPGSAKKKDS